MKEDSTKTRIRLTAEKLFAEQGIDAVSLRKISSAAGQKNKTAAQYHFDSKKGLVEAIFASRATGINHRRQELLDELLERGDVNLYGLIEIILKPFIELLLDEDGGRHYVHITAQMFSKGEAVELLYKFHSRSVPHPRLYELIANELSFLPQGILTQRAVFMSSLLAQATATKDFEMEGFSPSRRKRHIKKFCHELIGFVAGGMKAPLD